MAEYHMCNQAYRTCYKTCKRSALENMPQDEKLQKNIDLKEPQDGKLLRPGMSDDDPRESVIEYLHLQGATIPEMNDLARLYVANDMKQGRGFLDDLYTKNKLRALVANDLHWNINEGK